MLWCPEQKNPVEYRDRKLKFDDSWLNVYYIMCGMPVTASEVDYYLGYYCPEAKKHPELLLNEFLLGVVIQGIAEESINLIPDDVLMEHGLYQYRYKSNR